LSPVIASPWPNLLIRSATQHDNHSTIRATSRLGNQRDPHLRLAPSITGIFTCFCVTGFGLRWSLPGPANHPYCAVRVQIHAFSIRVRFLSILWSVGRNKGMSWICALLSTYMYTVLGVFLRTRAGCMSNRLRPFFRIATTLVTKKKSET
jgi:hypothetical protein